MKGPAISSIRSFQCSAKVSTRSSDRLRSNVLLKLFQLEVDLEHVGMFNQSLADAIQRRPGELLPIVRN